MDKQCIQANCSEPFCGNLYGGSPYCKAHYRERFLNDLTLGYKQWDQNSGPSASFKRLLGRFYDEYGTHTGESYLSSARIRDRGFEFMKTAEGLTFSITRHLGAWAVDKTMKRTVEQWKFDFQKGLFSKSGNRVWNPDDPE